jgi:tetratricopeptide (TPR) repeat protein
MKKIIIILLLAELSPVISGQEIYDYLLKGKALIEAGDQDNAVVLLSEALNIQQDYRIYIERATAYFIKHEYSLAISDFQAANSIKSGSGSYGLAETYSLKGDVVSSLYYLDIHLKSAFKTDEKVIMLNPAFSFIENTSEWRLFWKTERYSSFETGLSEIDYELSVGNIEEAEMLLNSLRKENPEEPDLIYATAMIAFSKKDVRETITLLSGVPVSKNSEKSLRLLAEAQSASENNPGAALTYSELIDREIVDANLLLQRADCYRKAGEREKALADVMRYMDLYPDNENGLSLAGKIESEKGDNIKALEYFSKNIELHPSVPQNYIDRANSYFSSSSWKNAIDDYSMALDLQPVNPEVYLNKGIALISLGNTDDACHDFRQSLKLGNKKATAYIGKYCIK